MIPSINFVEGQEYTIVIDGFEYKEIAWGFNGFVFVGTDALIGGEYTEGEAPFCIVSDGTFATIAGDGEHTLSIIGSIQKIQKLDAKYMPDSVVFAPIEPAFCANLFLIDNFGSLIGVFGDDAYQFFRSGYTDQEETLPATPEQWAKLLAAFHAAKRGQLVLYGYDAYANFVLLNAMFTTRTEASYVSDAMDACFYYDEENGVIVKTS